MPRIAAATTRTTIAAVAALVLAGCAVAEPSTGPGPDASGRASPSPSEGSADEGVFESQDGAVRMQLPEGWSVVDRSAMGEASEIYNSGPAWLNDLVVVDADGDQMLWYREAYGDDSFECVVEEVDLSQSVDPFSPDLRGELDAQAEAEGRPSPEIEIRVDLMADADWDGQQSVPTGEWIVSLDLMQQIQVSGEECGWDESVWAGNRVVRVSGVGDEPGSDSPASPIVLGSEQAARDWLTSDEAGMLVEVLASIELTGAPLLDQAP